MFHVTQLNKPFTLFSWTLFSIFRRRLYLFSTLHDVYQMSWFITKLKPVHTPYTTKWICQPSFVALYQTHNNIALLKLYVMRWIKDKSKLHIKFRWNNKRYKKNIPIENVYWQTCLDGRHRQRTSTLHIEYETQKTNLRKKPQLSSLIFLSKPIKVTVSPYCIFVCVTTLQDFKPFKAEKGVEILLWQK